MYLWGIIYLKKNLTFGQECCSWQKSQEPAWPSHHELDTSPFVHSIGNQL